MAGEVILPCPFCGGQAGVLGDGGLQRVACADPTGECPGSTVDLPAHNPERRSESIRRWNRRPSGSLIDLIDTLEMHAHRDIAPGWCSVPECEWDAVMRAAFGKS